MGGETTQIQSQCFNLEESLLSGDPKSERDRLLQSTENMNEDSGEDSQDDEYYDDEDRPGKSAAQAAMNAVPELQTEETTKRTHEPQAVPDSVRSRV